MAEQWITKSKKVNDETVETKFRIDADGKACACLVSNFL